MHVALRVHRLTKLYRAGAGGCRATVTALSGVSFEIAGGEAVAIVGAAGAGKSTLLLCAAGLLAADGGSVHAPSARYVHSDTVELRRAIACAGRRAAGVWLIDDCLRGIAASDYALLERWVERETGRGAAVVVASREASGVVPLVNRQIELHRGRVRPPAATRGLEVAAGAARVAEPAREQTR